MPNLFNHLLLSIGMKYTVRHICSCRVLELGILRTVIHRLIKFRYRRRQLFAEMKESVAVQTASRKNQGGNISLLSCMHFAHRVVQRVLLICAFVKRRDGNEGQTRHTLFER